MEKYKCLVNQVFKISEFTIVPIQLTDRFKIMQWRNEQVYHLRQNKPLTVEDQDYYFKNVVQPLFNEDKPNQLLFSFLKNDEFIGYGGLVHINWIDKNAELSFIIDTNLENNHFSECWSNFLTLIEKVAFNEIGLHKVFTYAFDLRPHLYPILINNGYQHEASLEDHCYFNGLFKDVLIHSKIKTKPYLRKVNLGDIEITYRWAVLPEIRKHSLNKKTIQLNEHHKWFTAKLNDDDCLYYILQLEDNSLGSVRIDLDDHRDGLISYLIDPLFQGKGYGKLLIEKMEQSIKSDKVSTLIAKVLKDNMASAQIFRKLNYKEFIEGDNYIFQKNLNK